MPCAATPRSTSPSGFHPDDRSVFVERTVSAVGEPPRSRDRRNHGVRVHVGRVRHRGFERDLRTVGRPDRMAIGSVLRDELAHVSRQPRSRWRCRRCRELAGSLFMTWSNAMARPSGDQAKLPTTNAFGRERAASRGSRRRSRTGASSGASWSTTSILAVLLFAILDALRLRLGRRCRRCACRRATTRSADAVLDRSSAPRLRRACGSIT